MTYGYGLSLVGGANATFAAKAAVVTASGAASGATRGGISAARLGRSGGPLGELSGGNFMVRTAIAAAAGGTAAEIGGGSFENGAISAAYTYMFNHAAEKGAEIWITRMAKTEAGYGLIDGIQDGLSVLGLVPFAGDVVDGINALIYLARGQHAEAAMSAAAMVPFGGIVSTGLRLSKRLGKLFKIGKSAPIQFGKVPNQVSHTFRHIEAAGLQRGAVQSAVEGHLKTVASQIQAGKPFNQIIEVGGQKLQYTAFKLADGTINVGRIHPVP